MKKILLFLLTILFVGGCGCKNEVKSIRIDYLPKATMVMSSSYLYGKHQLLSDELASTEEYDEKIVNKDSFVLFVYANGCFGCDLLAPALREYVNSNNILIYTLNKATISDKHDLYKAGVNTTPFILIVGNGKIEYIELFDNLDSENSEKNKETVEKWLNKRIEWSEN